jgi:SAM-dependent methyltransferase
MPVQDFGRVADIYDATRSLPHGLMQSVVEQLGREVGKSGSLVDIAVGTGRFAKPLQDIGVEVVGVDLSKGMVAKAKEKGLHNLFFADVHQLPFRDRTFDAALMVHILHLVGDWARVVREASRVSRGTVLSVINGYEGPDLEEVYLGIRNQMGYPLKRFEAGERGILDRVWPAKLVKVGQTEMVVQADEWIGRLLRRETSMTWDMPEDAHLRAIAELRSKYAGKTFRRKQSTELAVWTPDQLRLLYR